MSAIAAAAAAAAAQLSERTRRWVSEATAYSATAGPDAQAVAFGRQWGLGHALLQTGRDGRDQPLTRDSRVWLTADARLDGRADLISSLRSRGEMVEAGSSDPELLLAAYYVWGDGFVEQVAGDFAFALWDDARPGLLCGRDQLGAIPLHYARAGDELLVATALDALLLHAEVSDELDEGAIADFLLNARGDFTSTVFRAIRRLAPAHVGSWTARELRLRRYWRQESWPPLVRFKTAEEYRMRFLELLEAAVADRITDNRVAVHVSGGMDSTSVAAVAQRVLAARGLPNGALRGSTMVLGRDTGDQEGDYAKLVADKLGIELDLFDESLIEPLDPFLHVEPPMPLPEPVPYRGTPMEYVALSRCADHARVMFTGLPGDGLLMFVPWYWMEWIARGRMLRLTRAWLGNMRLFRDRPHPHLRRSARVAIAVSRMPQPAAPPWLAADFASRTSAAARMRPPVVARASRTDVRSLSQDPGWLTPFVWSSASYHCLPVVIRHPFADLRLLDFVARLPPEPWLVRKRILREATRDLLPEAVLERPKTLLARPGLAGITTQGYDRLAELVCALPDAERFFDTATLIEVLKDPSPAEHPHKFFLPHALGLVHWRMHWRRPVAPEPGPRDISNLGGSGSDEGVADTGRIQLS